MTRINFPEFVSNRDQLWAEATFACQIGESLTLSRELWADAAQEQEDRHAVDPWEDSLRDYLEADLRATA